MRDHASSDLRRGFSALGVSLISVGENAAGRGPSQASQWEVWMRLTSVQTLHVQVSGREGAGGVGFGVGRVDTKGVGLDCCTDFVLELSFGLVAVGNAGGSLFSFSSASILTCCARNLLGDRGGGGGPRARMPEGFSWLGGTYESPCRFLSSS